MPHFLNFDDMRESAFQLQHLCFGSAAYRQKYARDDATTVGYSESWEYYAGMMKSLVSEVLIQNATRTRIIQDTLRDFEHEEQDPFDVSEISRRAEASVVFARDLSDGKPLSLRGISNKIIHATDTRLEWAKGADGSYKHWTGAVLLFGAHEGKDWSIEVLTESYVHVLIRWLDLLDAEVDWRLVYDHDE